jgi:hypothetical protein
LMIHKTPLPEDLARASNVEVIEADLGNPATLAPAVREADVIVG